MNQHEKLMNDAFNATARNVAVFIFIVLAIGFGLGFIAATLI